MTRRIYPVNWQPSAYPVECIGDLPSSSRAIRHWPIASGRWSIGRPARASRKGRGGNPRSAKVAWRANRNLLSLSRASCAYPVGALPDSLYNRLLLNSFPRQRVSHKATPPAAQGGAAILEGGRSLKMKETGNRTFPFPRRNSPGMGFYDTLWQGEVWDGG